MVAKQSAFHHLMFPAPGPPRLRPVPTPVDVVGHGAAPIPAAPFALSSSSPPLALHAPPGAYSTSDERIFRMNGRPYWIHGMLGKGGYGEVFTAEMLLPASLEVAFSENGDIEIDNEDGCMLLRPKQSERENRLPPADAVESTFPSPPTSRSTFGDVDVSLAPEDQDEIQEPDGQDHGQTTSSASSTIQTPGPCAPTEKFVYSSGVFVALKMQTARSAKELALLEKEVENLRFLKGDQGVVQIMDHAVNYEFLKLGIVMELGVASFYGGENLTM